MSKTVPLFEVEIDRGRDVLTVAVPEHEVRVLQFIHGPDKVRPGKPPEGEEPETMALDASADAEIARLTRKYQRINAPDPVNGAYPLGAESLVKFGFELGRAPTEASPGSMVIKHKPAAKAKGAKAE